MNKFAADNARLLAFAAGLALLLTTDRETVVVIYLAAGFVWFLTWLVSGNHFSDKSAHGVRRTRKAIVEPLPRTGPVANLYRSGN